VDRRAVHPREARGNLDGADRVGPVKLRIDTAMRPCRRPIEAMRRRGGMRGRGRAFSCRESR
jgi:hypothetical protein